MTTTRTLTEQGWTLRHTVAGIEFWSKPDARNMRDRWSLQVDGDEITLSFVNAPTSMYPSGLVATIKTFKARSLRNALWANGLED